LRGNPSAPGNINIPSFFTKVITGVELVLGSFVLGSFVLKFPKSNLAPKTTYAKIRRFLLYCIIKINYLNII